MYTFYGGIVGDDNILDGLNFDFIFGCRDSVVSNVYFYGFSIGVGISRTIKSIGFHGLSNSSGFIPRLGGLSKGFDTNVVTNVDSFLT